MSAVLKCPCCEQSCPNCLELKLSWDNVKKFRGTTLKSLQRHRKTIHNCNYKQNSNDDQKEVTSAAVTANEFSIIETPSSQFCLPERYKNDTFVQTLVADSQHLRLRNQVELLIGFIATKLQRLPKIQ